MSFGPNRIEVVVRRLKRDAKTREPILDRNGKLQYEKAEVMVNHNVTCTTGLLAAKDRLFNTATAQTVCDYIALSESTHTPVAGDTLVAVEITQSGLARAQGAYSVAGCADGECIVSKTFTATGTFSGVRLMGLLDAASAGDLYFTATFTAVALESGDQLTAKWDKITLS
jgi:hypothetical protein